MLHGFRFAFAVAVTALALIAGAVAGEIRVNDPATISRTSAELEKLTGAHTRIVWIQDAGPTACAFSEKPTVRLMGFDSRDGKGEREIAPIGSYVKPLLTADGERIVFGNNVDNRIHMINWDGTGMRAVTPPGTAFEDVWTDPRDGLTWVYAKTSEKRGDKDIPVIRRFRPDKPDASELVWDRMPVWHFQVSGDGRTATGGSGDGGNSIQGMLTLPNGSFYTMAGGCWPSAAPDFSNRGWVFRGHHRGIHLCKVNARTGKSSGWPVEFEGAPGVPAQGYEVYHPRWSNNVRFFSMTAPIKYTEWRWKDATKLTNEGAAPVEVYLGKFTEDLRGIDGWVKVTRNERGDYWPDAWIEPGEAERLAAPQATGEQQIAEDTTPAAPDARGLIYAWENLKAANSITDHETGELRLCTGEFRGLGRFARHGVMDLAHGAFIPADADEPLLAACRKSGQLGIAAAITPASADQFGAAIISFASNDDSRNFSLIQRGEWLALRLRTSATDASGAELRLCKLQPGRPNCIAVNYSAGNTTCFVDGKPAICENSLTGDFRTLSEQHLVFGDEWHGGHDWAGTLEGIAIYARSISAGEARARFAAFAERLAERAPAARLVVDAKLVQRTPPPDPKAIHPYRRCLSVQVYEIQKIIEGKCDQPRIHVAQYSVMDGMVLEPFSRMVIGASFRLALEPFGEHPEQESERLMNSESDKLGAPLFYDVGRVVLPAAAGDRTGVCRLTLWPGAAGAARHLTLNKPLALFGRGNVLSASMEDGRGPEIDIRGQELTLSGGDLGELKLAGEISARGSGSVRAVAVLLGGDGYTQAPSVSFIGQGAGAAAAATMQVSELRITKVGSGYKAAPDVRLSAPDVAGGTQAAAVAKINPANGTVSELRVTDPGSGYLRQPAVAIAGGDGTGAAGEAMLSVSEIHVTNSGTGYAMPPEVVLAGACGAPAIAAAALQQTVFAYTDQGGGVRLANGGTIQQDGSFVFIDWAAAGRAGSPNRAYANAGTWTLRNGSRILFTSSTGQPIWAGGGCTNSGTMRLDGGSAIGFRDFTNTGTLELGAGCMLGQHAFADADIVLTNGPRGIINVSGSTAERPAVFGAIGPYNNGSRTVNNGTAEAGEAELSIGTGKDSAVFEIRGGNVFVENSPSCSVTVRAGATLGLITDDAGSQHMFVNRHARLVNRGTLSLAGRIKLGGNHCGDQLVNNSGTVAISGSASIERLKASAGDGAFYGEKENPTRLICQPGGTLLGAGTLAYVNGTGSDKMKSLNVLNCGAIAPGEQEGKPGTLALEAADVTFGNGEEKGALPRGAGILRIDIAGTPDQPAKFDVLHVSGTVAFTAGAGNALEIIAPPGFAPSGGYRIVACDALNGRFDVLRYNGKENVPFTVEYGKDGIDVIFR